MVLPVRFTLAVALLSAGCLTEAAITCEDGRVCPASQACASGGGCAPAGQVAACDGAGLTDGEPCTFLGTGAEQCLGGVCVSTGCGDGVTVAPEDCDGGVGATTCVDVGFYAGTLGCTAACSFDTSGCVGACGDGVRDAVEACDGVATQSCASIGFDAGRPACSDACALDPAPCIDVGLADFAGASSTVTPLWAAPTGELFGGGLEVLYSRTPAGELETATPTVEGQPWLDVAGCDATSVWAYTVATSGIQPRTYFAHYDGASWTVAPSIGGLTTAITCTADGVLFSRYGGAERGIWRFDGVAATQVADTDLDGPAPGAITALQQASDGRLWVGASTGLWSYADATWRLEPSLADGVVALDRTITWASGASGAIYHLVDDAWQLDAALGAPAVSLEAAGARLWAATSGGKLWLRDARGWSTLSDAEVRDLALLPDGVVASTAVGVQRVTDGWFALVGPNAIQRSFRARDGALWSIASNAVWRADQLVLAGGATFAAVFESGDGKVWLLSAGDSYVWQDGSLTLLGAFAAPGFAPAPEQPTILGATGASDQDYMVLRQLPAGPGVPGPREVVHVVGGSEVPGDGFDGRVLWGPGDGTAYSINSAGVLFRFDGSSWTGVDVGTDLPLAAVGGAAADDVWVAGAGGFASRWDGTAWSPPPPGATAGFATVACVGARCLGTTSGGEVAELDALGWTPIRGISAATGVALDGDERRVVVDGTWRRLLRATEAVAP